MATIDIAPPHGTQILPLWRLWVLGTDEQLLAGTVSKLNEGCFILQTLPLTQRTGLLHNSHRSQILFCLTSTQPSPTSSPSAATILQGFYKVYSELNKIYVNRLNFWTRLGFDLMQDPGGFDDGGNLERDKKLRKKARVESTIRCVAWQSLWRNK